MNSIVELKQKMRTDQMARRSALTEKERKSAAVAISSSFMGNVPMGRSDRIGLYNPMPGEVDITLLTDALMEESYACALPVVLEKGKPLIFRQCLRNMNMQKNYMFNVMEPPDNMPEIRPTILVVPLVAFDAKGYRLGFGGGFYDMTIEHLEQKAELFKVGIAYSFQQVAMVPHEEHDQRLDCVITEKDVVICAKL